LGESDKLVGLRVRHNQGNPVRGISFKIAKRCPIDDSLTARLESIKGMKKISNHLMAHDTIPTDPNVKVDYRITEIYGYHEGHNKNQFPLLSEIIKRPLK
jgi:hypothetical protein